MDIERFKEIFWNKVEKTDGCWIWQGGKNKDGYGTITSSTEYGIYSSRLAHRISYWLTYGDYDTKLKVCHECDNPSCVNPNHLFLGTQKDNMVDMVNKNRNFAITKPESQIRGEEVHCAKLTMDKAREIRKIYKEGATLDELAQVYNVSIQSIFKVVHYKSWKE